MVSSVIDLFSGCGGLSSGFEKAGYKISLGIDNWDLALETFKLNHLNSQILKADLSGLNPSTVESRFGLVRNKVDVIVGGPPCQGYSISGKRLIDDSRNQLYRNFVEFVSYYRPRAFVMENVPNLVSMAKGKFKKEITEDFERLGYRIETKILLASDFGVPQNRRRVFFVGLLGNGVYAFPNPTHGSGMKAKITTWDAISDLPEFDVADGTPYVMPPQSDFQKYCRTNSKAIFNHETIKHSEKTKSIIRLVPDGGNYKDLPSHLRSTRKVNIAWTRFASDKPSLTIDTGHNHHFHYCFDRVPTARESARLQSFDDSFIFVGRKNEQIRQIGNAVPPLLAKAVAEELRKYL